MGVCACAPARVQENASDLDGNLGDLIQDASDKAVPLILPVVETLFTLYPQQAAQAFPHTLRVRVRCTLHLFGSRFACILCVFGILHT